MYNLVYKNQLFFLFLIILFLIHSVFKYRQNQILEVESSKSKEVISQVRCSFASQSTSSIKIIKNGRRYSIELPAKRCINYAVGDTVQLFYNKKYDYYYLPGLLYLYKQRVVYCLIGIGLLLLPWKFFNLKFFKIF